MKYAIIIARILLGLMFAVFGSNAFLHFIPMQPMKGEAGAFIGALINSGYIYPIAALEVVGGLLLLIGARFVPLGLTLLGPVIVNIVLYHIFLDTSGLAMAGCISIFALFLQTIRSPDDKHPLRNFPSANRRKSRELSGPQTDAPALPARGSAESPCLQLRTAARSNP